MKYWNLIFIISFACIANNLFAQDGRKSFSIKAISKPMIWVNHPSSFVEDDDGAITISCNKGETLFSPPLGKYSNQHNCPIALFQPSSEFVLRAKVSSPLTEQWDAAQLIVWADTLHWAKLYLEKTHYKKPIVGSIVTIERSDDNNSMILDQPEIYLQIARVEDAIFFYCSKNGDDWTFVRAFYFKQPNIMIGFSCESTFNISGNSAVFSEIKYEERKLTDIFNGI